MDRALTGERVSFELTADFAAKGQCDIEVTCVPHEDDQGTVVGCYVLFIDLTERNLSEAQLQQAQKMEAVGQLTGGVAHDFNNLLTVVVGNLDLLLDLISDNTKFKKPIDTALRAALRGRDLTQRLLAFSRTQLLAPKPMEVNECVSTVAGLMRRTLGEDVEIETVLADGLWQAMADESQLENVLLNLDETITRE